MGHMAQLRLFGGSLFMHAAMGGRQTTREQRARNFRSALARLMDFHADFVDRVTHCRAAARRTGLGGSWLAWATGLEMLGVQRSVPVLIRI